MTSTPSAAAASPTVSAIICAYTLDRWTDIVAAVRSIEAQDRPAIETVIVADHNAALLDRVRQELPGVVAVENAEARGLSGARNTGIAVSRGEIIAFLDDDAWAEPSWLGSLVSAYADTGVIGVGGWISPAWQAGRPRWWPDEFDWVVGCSYRGLPPQRSEVRNMIGANMSFRRDVFDRAGTFAHGIGRIGTRPLGGEETELSIRARRAYPGARVMYEPAARVNHRVPAARGTARYFLNRCYSEGLSKAAIAVLVGADRALASERTYVVRTLGSGIVGDVADVVRRRDPYGLARATWIVIGLAATSLGYVVGRLSAGRAGGADPA